MEKQFSIVILCSSAAHIMYTTTSWSLLLAQYVVAARIGV